VSKKQPKHHWKGFMMMPKKRSWKTTTCGILALVAAVALAGVALLDGNPETMPDTEALLAAITGIGLLLARDNDRRSSEVLGPR